MSYGSYPQVPPPYPQQQPVGYYPVAYAPGYPHGYAPAQAAYSLPPATHPPAGVISFTLGLLSVLGVFLLFVVAIMVASQSDGVGRDGEGESHAVALGGIYIVSVLFTFIGVALGIAGLLQSGRRRVFPILGVGLNLLVLAFLVLLMLAAVAAQNG